MSFKIRTKLIIAFFAIILPFIVIGGILVLYSADAIHNSVHKIQSISEERAEITNLILAMDKAIMQANDYIITGDSKYSDNFYIASNEVEKRLQKVGELIPAEDRKVPSDAGIAWQNIKETALKIFAIPEPIGNKDAARFMEEMDYKWAYPAIERLKELRATHIEEFKEASRIADRAWVHSWIIMIVGAFALTVIGIFFAFFYSSRFTRPIKAIHNGADVIAGGNFKTRLEIKTGDEIEQLSNAMNEMAAQLDSFYSNLQGMVDERTREVKESETRFRGIVETAKDAMICISENGIIYQWNKSAEEIFGYSADEAIGKNIHSLIIPERFCEKAYEGFKTFSQTGTGPIIGKTIELVGLKKGGAEFPVELSVSAMNIKGRLHAVGIMRNITKRKEAEYAIKRQLDELLRFQKATIDREFRMKELKDRVREMEEKLKRLKG